MSAGPVAEGHEFRCVGCGRHIISFPAYAAQVELCCFCLMLPGWQDDPELRKRLDPDEPEDPNRDLCAPPGGAAGFPPDVADPNTLPGSVDLPRRRSHHKA